MSTEFPINIERISPYKNFKFLVHWDGKPVAGVSKISGLKRTTEIVSHRDGGDVSSQRLSPGLSKFTALTLERGITYDPEFEAWANKVHSQEGAGAVSLAGFRKNLRIELLNLQGTAVRAYDVYRCWVSEYQALPDLDANANAIAFESLILQHEGFARDEAVGEILEF